MPTDNFEIAAGADDVYIWRQGVTWPPTGGITRGTADTVLYASKDLNAGTYTLSHGLLRWDTSSLPNISVISAATLRVYIGGKVDDEGRSLTAGWYAWDGVSDTDITDSTETNAHAGTLISTFVGDTTPSLTLDNADANVSRTGYTHIRLHLSGGVPTGRNLQGIAAFEITGLTNWKAMLSVTYTLPTVTRLAPEVILAQTNLTGAVSTIQDDPDSPDGNWLTAP